MTMINNPEMHGGSSLWLGRTLNGAGQGSIETKKSVRPVRASGRNFDNTIPPIAELQSRVKQNVNKRAGALRRVLNAWEPPASTIYAVYPGNRLMSMKVRASSTTLRDASGARRIGMKAFEKSPRFGSPYFEAA